MNGSIHITTFLNIKDEIATIGEIDGIDLAFHQKMRQWEVDRCCGLNKGNRKYIRRINRNYVQFCKRKYGNNPNKHVYNYELCGYNKCTVCLERLNNEMDQIKKVEKTFDKNVNYLTWEQWYTNERKIKEKRTTLYIGFIKEYESTIKKYLQESVDAKGTQNKWKVVDKMYEYIESNIIFLDKNPKYAYTVYKKLLQFIYEEPKLNEEQIAKCKKYMKSIFNIDLDKETSKKDSNDIKPLARIIDWTEELIK